MALLAISGPSFYHKDHPSKLRLKCFYGLPTLQTKKIGVISSLKVTQNFALTPCLPLFLIWTDLPALFLVICQTFLSVSLFALLFGLVEPPILQPTLLLNQLSFIVCLFPLIRIIFHLLWQLLVRKINMLVPGFLSNRLKFIKKKLKHQHHYV